MCLDSHLLAHIQYGTSGTMREAAGTNVFPKWDEQTIDINPILFRKFRFQLDHALFLRGRLYISPAIRDAVNVNVHANERLATGNSHHKMRALWTDTRKRTQGFFIAGKLAIELIYNTLCQLVNLNRLALMKCRLPDQRIDFIGGKPTHFLWRARFLEQSPRHGNCHLIVRTNRNH